MADSRSDMELPFAPLTERPEPPGLRFAVRHHRFGFAIRRQSRLQLSGLAHPYMKNR